MSRLGLLVALPASIALHGAAVTGGLWLLPRDAAPPVLFVEISEAASAATVAADTRTPVGRRDAAPRRGRDHARPAPRAPLAAEAPVPPTAASVPKAFTPPARPPDMPAQPPDMPARPAEVAVPFPEVPVRSAEVPIRFPGVPDRSPEVSSAAPADSETAPVAVAERVASAPADDAPPPPLEDHPNGVSAPPSAAVLAQPRSAAPALTEDGDRAAGAMAVPGAVIAGPGRGRTERGSRQAQAAFVNRAEDGRSTGAGPDAVMAGNARGAPGGRGDDVAAPAPGGSDGGAEYGAYLGLIRRRIQQSLHYPSAARRRSLTGTVQLEILVGPSGAIARVAVVDASPHRLLDEAAVETVRALPPVPFPPGLPPRTLRARLPIVFELRSLP